MATRAACYAGYAFLLLANILSYHATTAFAACLIRRRHVHAGARRDARSSVRSRRPAVPQRRARAPWLKGGRFRRRSAVHRIRAGAGIMQRRHAARVRGGHGAHRRRPGGAQLAVAVALPMFPTAPATCSCWAAMRPPPRCARSCCNARRNGTSPSPWHRCWRHAPAPPGCASHGPSSAPSPAR